MYCVYLLIKARNRFKNEKIVDICDLAVKLYGEKARPWISILLVAANALFLMCYVIFFGQEIDQLFCKTLAVTECGHAQRNAVVINIILLPVVFQKKLRNIGFFSIVVLIFTFVSIGMISYICFDTYSTRKEQGQAKLEYKSIDLAALPMFCAAMMTLFEGN